LGLSLVDPICGADFQARHLLLALKCGEPYRVVRALAMEGAFSSSSGGHSRERTEKILQTALSLAQEIKNPHAIALVILTNGIAAFCEGRWLELRKLSEEVEKILRSQCTGVTWELDNAQHFYLRALFYLGEWSKLCNRLPAMLREG